MSQGKRDLAYGRNRLRFDVTVAKTCTTAADRARRAAETCTTAAETCTTADGEAARRFNDGTGWLTVLTRLPTTYGRGGGCVPRGLVALVRDGEGADCGVDGWPAEEEVAMRLRGCWWSEMKERVLAVVDLFGGAAGLSGVGWCWSGRQRKRRVVCWPAWRRSEGERRGRRRWRDVGAEAVAGVGRVWGRRRWRLRRRWWRRVFGGVLVRLEGGGGWLGVGRRWGWLAEMGGAVADLRRSGCWRGRLVVEGLAAAGRGEVVGDADDGGVDVGGDAAAAATTRLRARSGGRVFWCG